MTPRRKVAKDETLRVRIPSAVLAAFDKHCGSLQLSRSERLRQLVERSIAEDVPVSSRGGARRLRRVRRCVCCSAFVRNGFTCKTCRSTITDSIVVGGMVVPIPYLHRQGMVLRPDVRDSRWSDAEAITLDAFAPVVAIVYEVLSGDPSFEMTDLDDIADLLSMAVSLRN